MVTMCGWFSAEAAFASWTNRCLALRVGELLGREDLQRDEPVQVEVLGLVDDPHSAFAELLDDAIVAERPADHAVSPVAA